MTATTELSTVGGVTLDGLRYQRIGTTALITLARPEVGNALTPAMRQGVSAIWRDIAADRTVRAVVVTGAGDRHFCTGVDVRAVAATGTTTTGDGPAREEILWSPHNHGVRQPVICAVNGLAAGGGLHFVADADLVVASTSAAFMDTHTSVGMVGAVENVGLTHRLPLGTVLRLTLWGKHWRMTAARAHQLGLVDELYEPEALVPAALELAAQVARNSPAAVARSKQGIWNSLGRPREDAEEYAWALARLQQTHPDFREGARAFAERRDPEWSA